MPKLAVPLTDIQPRTAKPKDKPYKMTDGGGLYLLVNTDGEPRREGCVTVLPANEQARNRLRVAEPVHFEGIVMRHVTLEQLTDILEVMNIKQSIDSGFAITHHGDLDGQQIIAISTCRGDGDCYIVG